MRNVINRRKCIATGVAVLAGGSVAGRSLLTARQMLLGKGNGNSDSSTINEAFFPPRHVHSITPVVGDGKWIWNEPPKEQTGYLEPRAFDVTVGIRLEGQGDASGIIATTVTPVETPEQKIVEVVKESQGCRVELRQLDTFAGQLGIACDRLSRGQVAIGQARYRVELHKDFRGLERDKFPMEQEFDRDFILKWGIDSPGIQTRHSSVKDLAKTLSHQAEHPWDQAKIFYEWVRKNIKPQIQGYTSVIRALRDRVGDCEECAAVFVALCRASGIPARLVWVPGHNWAEFCLKNESGEPIWIPAHTSAYTWFGWTGVHEVILQKGDRIPFPEKREEYRLLVDWMQWKGRKPKTHFFATIEPVPPKDEADAGPGARLKQEDGRWIRTGDYARAKFNRE